MMPAKRQPRLRVNKGKIVQKMSETEKSILEPKEVSDWVCVDIGVGFIAGVSGLIIAVLVLAGS